MAALQALCIFEAIGEDFRQQLDGFLRDPVTWVDLGFEHPPAVEHLQFARRLVLGAWEQRQLLDRRLAAAAAHWSLSRMTPVDRNVLRLGLHELLEWPETPPQVIINEAIELARRFGDADSPAFVNGVLDAMYREISAETAGGPFAEPPTPPLPNHREHTEGSNGVV